MPKQCCFVEYVCRRLAGCYKSKERGCKIEAAPLIEKSKGTLAEVGGKDELETDEGKVGAESACSVGRAKYVSACGDTAGERVVQLNIAELVVSRW